MIASSARNSSCLVRRIRDARGNHIAQRHRAVANVLPQLIAKGIVSGERDQIPRSRPTIIEASLLWSAF
jgi:hypothetical protein